MMITMMNMIDLVNELRNSEYSKRIALFNEINKAIK